MKWVLYDFKTSKEAWHEEAEKLYIKKIKPFVDFEVQHLKTIQADRDESAIKLRHEEKIILDKLTKDDFVILLDEKGKKLDSLQFAQQIQKINQSGKKRGVLIIGGAFGVTENIKKRSDFLINLSEFTMNHLVAEVVIFEQFYRAWTITKNIPYHNL